jgi:integrase
MKLSKRTIDAIELPPSGFIRVWDTETKGFHLRVRANGRKTFELKYRVGKRQVTMTIGDFGAFTAETAREAANEAKRAARLGGDPLSERRAMRNAITVRELIDRYLKGGPTDKPNKRASSWETDRINLRRHVEPLLGSRPVRDLTSPELALWQRNVVAGKTAMRGKTAKEIAADMAPPIDAETPKLRGRTIVRGGRACAARAMTSLSAMLSWAARHGVIAENPTRHVEKLPTGKRERFLTEGEAKALWGKMAELEAAKKLRPDVADLFRLLALTGARRGEMLGLRWDEIKWERSSIVLPPDRHKSGSAGKERVIHLDATAVAILRSRQRNVLATNNRLERIVPWVFPKQDGKAPIEPPKRTWAALRAAAGLDGLRCHDLRHSYASFLLSEGTPLAIVGKALGHTRAVTTERYAHLRDEATQRGAAHVASVYALPSAASGQGD